MFTNVKMRVDEYNNVEHFRQFMVIDELPEIKNVTHKDLVESNSKIYVKCLELKPDCEHQWKDDKAFQLYKLSYYNGCRTCIWEDEIEEALAMSTDEFIEEYGDVEYVAIQMED